MAGMEIWKDSEILYDGAIVRLRVGEVTLDDGRVAKREVVEHPGGVCVLPFDGTHVTLVRQFRVALGQEIIEAPAGKLEGDEDPEHRGKTELEEEAGLRAGRMVSAGGEYVSVGFCTEMVYLYLAFDLESVPQRLDEDERIELIRMPLDEMRTKLLAHEFNDGKTIILMHALLNHLVAHPEDLHDGG